jgi:hypothetical protein
VARQLRPLAAIWAPSWATSLRRMVSAQGWSSSVARAHAVVVSVLTRAEILIAVRRLAEHDPTWLPSLHRASRVTRSGCGSGGLKVEPAEGVEEQALAFLISEDGEWEPWPELEFGGGQVDARYLVEPLPELLAELHVVER